MWAESLEILSRNAAESLASESVAEERQRRLVSMRTNLAKRIENESVQKRGERLEVSRETERRATNVLFREENVDSHEEYIHQRGREVLYRESQTLTRISQKRNDLFPF